MTPLPDARVARVWWLAAAGLTVVIFGLHGWLWAHAGAFSRDEVNTLNLAATHSPAQMTRDSFPILLPVLLAGWQTLGLGSNDFALRLLGCLIGDGLVLSLWLLAWRARRSPPLWSLILLGANGTAIFWTDYLRAYGLGSLLIVLTFAALCSLLERPHWRRAAWLAAAGVLSVQTLYQNALFFAAIGIGGWLVCWRRRDQRCAGMILAAALPAVLLLLPYLAAVRQWEQATTIRPGFSPVAALDNLKTMLAFPAPQYVWLWGVLALAVLACAGRSLVQTPMAGGEDRALAPAERPLLAGAVLLLSVGGYWIFLRLAGLITSPWYFLPLITLGAACFDLGLPAANARWQRLAMAGVWLGTAVPAASLAVRDLNCRFTNLDVAAHRVEQQADPADYVLVTPWYLGITFNRYYHGPAAWDTLPPIADHTVHRFDLVPTSAAGLAQARQPVLERAARALREGHRVWVVGWMAIPSPLHRATSPESGFLAGHSRSFMPVNLQITGQTSDYEDAVLLCATGWQTNAP